MSFNQNMSPKEVADLDRERGKKFNDPNDTWMGDDHPKEKKPWLIKTPVNKSGEQNMDGVSILDKFTGRSNTEDDSNQDTSKGVEPGDCASGADILEKFVSKGGADKKDPAEMGNPNSGEDDILSLDDDRLDITDAKKALSTRSMHIPRPRTGYDSFDINRSVSTATTRGHSKLRGPNGVAPLVGETLEMVDDDASARSKLSSDTLKSCSVHGRMYKSSVGCVICKSIEQKSNPCGSCGEEMFKQVGGTPRCTTCG